MKDIAELIAGFEVFKTKYFTEDHGVFSQRRESQRPTTMIISCCDSRVDPAMLTSADPGDLFVVRNVANLVPPYRHEAEAPGIRSALEFAVKSLQVEHIIVLGHSGCGGIEALMNGEGITETHYEFIGAWVSIAKPARDQALREFPRGPRALQARACERHSILVSLENLLSFPWIRERVDNNVMSLHGWYFDIEAGSLLRYSAQTGSFDATGTA